MGNIRRKLFCLFDFVLVLGAFLLTGWLAPGLGTLLQRGGLLYGPWVETLSPPAPAGEFSPLSQFLWVFLIVAPVTVMCAGLLGGHGPLHQQPKLRLVAVTLLSPLGGLGCLSTIFFALKAPGYSRVFVFSFAGTTSLLIATTRAIGRAWYRFTLREGVNANGVAIAGDPEAVRAIAARLRKEAAAGQSLVGYFSLNGESGPIALEQGGGLACLGDVADLNAVLVQKAIQNVIMVVPPRGAPWLRTAVGACDYLRTTVQIVPEPLLTSHLGDLTAEHAAGIGDLPALTLAPRESRDAWLVVKRVLDVCVSGALLILLAPVFLAIAVAIKLTTPDLPVFYPWRVVGYRGRRFTGYKFTTMVLDADDTKEKLAYLNEMTGPVFKIADDPRVTPLGRILRKYSLNELPQLWSVLKGDMSLVGPRPAGPHELVRYELWHKRKLSAKPGITCFWQVRGRNRISNFDDWVRLDLEYIRTRSFWVDCKILARTAWVVVRGTGS